MNVLEVYTSYLPKKGGVQSHIRDLCTGLLENGHRPIILASTPSSPRVETIDGVLVWRIRIPPLFYYLRYPYILFLSLNILYLIKKYKITAIHAHDYLPGVSAALAGFLSHTSTLVTFHLPVQKTTYYPSKFLKPFFLVEKVFQLLFNFWVHKVVCVSRFTLEQTLKLDFPVSKLRLIYNWVSWPSTGCLPVKHVLKELNLCERPFILSTGRLFEKQKPFSLLIRAFKSLMNEKCDLDLVIVGNGPDKEFYQKCASTLNIADRIHFLENTSDEQLSVLYEGCILFILPSYYEGLPIVLLEAMAHGKPVISTQVGGVPEVIREGYNGALVETSALGLFEGMMWLLSQGSDIGEFGMRSKEIIVECFSKSNLDETICLIDDMPKGK